MKKSFKQFINDKGSKPEKREHIDYSEYEYDDLVNAFSKKHIDEGLKARLGTSLGSVLAFSAQSRLKKEKDLHKKLNLMSTMILAGLAAIISANDAKE